MNITKKINFGIFLIFLIFILILKQSFIPPSIILKGKQKSIKKSKFFFLNSEKPIFQVKSAKSVENRSWHSNFRKIFFLKTHKTASSTIENIMMRLCWNYNKTLARKDWKIFSSVFFIQCVLRFLTFSLTKILGTNRVSEGFHADYIF